MPRQRHTRYLTTLLTLALVAIVATSLLAYRTVDRVRIGSDEFDRVLLYSSVIADTIPAPATLSDAYLLNVALLDAADASEVEATVALLDQSETAYRASIDRWTAELRASSSADAPRILALLDEVAVPAERFWSLVHDEVVPAARAGDTATALETVFGPLRDAFQDHHGRGNGLFAELQNAQLRQEDRTTAFIERERNIALAVVAALAVVLVATAVTMRRKLKRAHVGGAGAHEVTDRPSNEQLDARVPAGVS